MPAKKITLVNPRIWGPQTWLLLYDVAVALDRVRSRRRRVLARELFAVLALVLPCRFCRANLAAHLAASPYRSGSAVRWMWFLKNAANRNSKVPQSQWLPWPVFLKRLEVHQGSMACAEDARFVFATFAKVCYDTKDAGPERCAALRQFIQGVGRLLLAYHPRWRRNALLLAASSTRFPQSPRAIAAALAR